MLRSVALVRTDVSEEYSVFFFSSRRRRSYVPPKRQFLQKSHGLTSQKTQLSIITPVKTYNLTTPIRLDVFTTVTVKNAVCWDVGLCDSCKNRRFGGTYRLFVARRLLSFWRWRQYVPPKLLFLKQPQGVISQKMAFFNIRIISL
jgi:hypothetical protein